MTTSAKVRRYLAKGKSADYIAKALGVPKNYVWTIVWKERKKAEAEAATTAKPKKPGRPKKVEPQRWVEITYPGEAKIPGSIPADLVNHPPHYTAGGIETIDFIEAKDLNYRLGNVIKYVSRAGKKASDPVQDLEKAAFYLKREIDARKGA
jgi:transposase